ncbi:MAG: hypothetical protein QOF62_121 [Pyrinomonadaceae bacterium]|jgi:hypothetical protein|nr:hypothetical protein [Pyrinomonadaceae bacterium]
MGHFLSALRSIPSAPRLTVVGSFTPVGQTTSALNPLFNLFFLFRHLLNSLPPFRPELVSEEFVRSQAFYNSVSRIFLSLSPLDPMNTHTRIGDDYHGK